MFSSFEPAKREDSKSVTRARVLESARTLFAEVGFDKATIRAIAERAGVSSGSVFTSFTNKAELLMEVLQEKYQKLFVRLELKMSEAETAEGALNAYAGIAYAFELEEQRLLAEQIGVSWIWSAQTDAQNRRKLEPLFQLLVGAVRRGQDEGELDAKADPALLADMIFAIYVRNFRRALFDGVQPEALAALFRTQLRHLLDGVRARPAIHN
jgi:AcrR family transcriptional regulator